MAYTFDPVFAVDPANPANVAKNASITIFDPADPAQAPIAIQDPTGVPLPNPITVDAAGMGPAYQHPTLARVGWKGAGFVGYFTSYEGMYNETQAAKTAAQTAASSATTAASEVVTTAAVNGSGKLILTKATGATVDAGSVIGPSGPKGDKGLDGANVLPTAEAIAQAVTTDGPAKAALNATYAPKVTGGYLPLDEAEANYAQLSTLAATFRPATTRQQQPAESIITTFSSGHLWATSGTGVTWDLNYTGDAFAGSQCVRGTTLGTNVEGSVQSISRTPTIDLTNKVIVLPIKVVSGLANISTLRMLLSDNNFTANSSVSLINGASVVPSVIREGEWYTFRFTLADVTSSSGTPNLAAVNAIRIALRDKGAGGVAVVEFGKMSYYTPPTATQYPNGAVTLWFDDSYASHRTIAAPHLARYGFAGSEAVICDKIDGSGMTLTQLKELAGSYGWEINPHSYTVASHAAGFDTLTEAQLVDEVNSIKSWMAGNGFGANDHIAYPLGRHNSTTDEVIGRYFSTARTTNPLPLDTMLTGNRLRTRCVATDNTTTLAGMQAVIDRAHRAGVWLQIYFHDIVADGTANTSVKMETTIFKGIIDYLNTKGSRVMTAGEVWNAGI